MDLTTVKQRFSTIVPKSYAHRWSRRYWLIATPIVLGILLLLTFWAHQHLINQMSNLLVLELDRIGLELEQQPTRSVADLQMHLSTLPSSFPRTFTYIDEQGNWIDSAESPSPYRQPTKIRPASPEYAQSSQLFTLSGWLDNPALFARFDSPSTSFSIIAQISGKTIFAEMLKMIFPFVFVMLLTWTLVGWGFTQLLQQRTDQLHRLASAAIEVAEGNIDTSIDIGEDTSLGILGSLFDQMRRTLKSQIDESTLQLTTSQAVAQTINVQEGIPIVLRAIIEGISADGARAIIVNPAANMPLLFGEGSAAAGMGGLDRRLWRLMQKTGEELIFRTEEQIRTQLDLPPERNINIQSLIAFPLHTQEQLSGVIWVGFGTPLESMPPRLNLLRSLIGSASALVANMRLFVSAEGGRRRLAAVLSSTADAVVVVDSTDHILLLNPAMEEAFQLHGQALIGHAIQKAIHNPDLLDILTLNVLQVHGREIIGQNGKIYFSSVASVRGNNGGIIGRVAVLHDITQMKELDQLKSELIASVSHDLRNPLTYMYTYASMLDESALSPSQRKYVVNIQHGIKRMHNIIGALLDINRIESAVDTLDIQQIDVETFFKKLADENAPQASLTGNHIVVAPFSEPMKISADLWSLRSAINNLISNALTYAANTGDIILDAQATPDYIVLSVQDHGMGISKTDQARIFEKFYRSADPSTLRIEGTGLGLALVKSIANRHGGRVWCKSDINKGSTFYVAFPNQPVAMQHPVMT